MRNTVFYNNYERYFMLLELFVYPIAALHTLIIEVIVAPLDIKLFMYVLDNHITIMLNN